MIFTAAALPGVWLIDMQRHADDRGYFARAWCAREFEQQGLTEPFVQANVAHNAQAGTLRGLHWQAEPHAEAKLVRVSRGAAYFVALELASLATSPRWEAYELSAANGRSLWIPRHCAIGYQTLMPDTDIDYHMTNYFHPDSARGLRYNDPRLNVAWPLAVSVISQRDLSWPLLA